MPKATNSEVFYLCICFELFEIESDIHILPRSVWNGFSNVAVITSLKHHYSLASLSR